MTCAFEIKQNSKSLSCENRKHAPLALSLKRPLTDSGNAQNCDHPKVRVDRSKRLTQAAEKPLQA